MKYIKTVLLLLTFATFVITSSSYAISAGKGSGKPDSVGSAAKKNIQGSKARNKEMGKGIKSKPQNLKEVGFSRSTRETIRDFAKTNSIPRPALPPGIAKNILRGKPVPPGIQKVFLPASLSSKLPYVPGFRYQVVGDDVILVNDKTGIVADILAGVLRSGL